MSVERIPLAFALKHLHVERDDASAGSSLPGEASIRLMQGERAIPPAGDRIVKEFLDEECDGTLPSQMDQTMLEMMFPVWPQHVRVTFHGISTFGAGVNHNAKACAQHALRSDSNCVLARQLVSLLRAKTEVRCPFGANASDAPNVPEIIAREVM